MSGLACFCSRLMTPSQPYASASQPYASAKAPCKRTILGLTSVCPAMVPLLGWALSW
jgi:hypothetical protein